MARKTGSFRSPPAVNTRKVILVKADPCHGFPTQVEPEEWFLVLTDPAPRKFVCSGATSAEAIQRAEARGFSFEEDPGPFPPGQEVS